MTPISWASIGTYRRDIGTITFRDILEDAPGNCGDRPDDRTARTQDLLSRMQRRTRKGPVQCVRVRPGISKMRSMNRCCTSSAAGKNCLDSLRENVVVSDTDEECPGDLPVYEEHKTGNKDSYEEVACTDEEENLM